MPDSPMTTAAGEAPVATVRDWQSLRREIVDLICDGMASRDGRPSHHVEASDLLAEYVTALDIAKAEANR